MVIQQKPDVLSLDSTGRMGAGLVGCGYVKGRRVVRMVRVLRSEMVMWIVEMARSVPSGGEIRWVSYLLYEEQTKEKEGRD